MFFYTDGCDHTVGLYMYDDPSISGGCVHNLDLRLHLILLIQMVVSTMDSCFDIIYVYVYVSLICKSPDSVCPCPC